MMHIAVPMPICTTGFELHVLDILQEDERHHGAGTLLLDGNRWCFFLRRPIW